MEKKKKLKSTENGFVRIRAENIPNDKKKLGRKIEEEGWGDEKSVIKRGTKIAAG